MSSQFPTDPVGVPEKEVPVVKVASRTLSSMRFNVVCCWRSSGDAAVLHIHTQREEVRSTDD